MILACLLLLSSQTLDGQLVSGATPGTPLAPPNVLVLLADDTGVDSIAAYAEGGDLPSTPRIDGLAAGGLLFRNAWSQPVCSPTRGAILTGRHAFRTGLGWLSVEDVEGSALPLAEWTLPEILDLDGGQYAHAAIGKWHLGNTEVGGMVAPNQAGFSHFAGTLTNLVTPYDYFTWPKVVDGNLTISNNYATTETVDDALAWISTQTSPWFCYVAFNAAHTPFHDPPANLHTVDLTKPTDRLRYKAMVEALDTEIGRLLDSLPAGVLDDTMVIFLGDNGSSAKITVPPFDPDHAKGRMYEGGVNVPLIVSGPLVIQPGEVRGLVTATDLFQTVLGIAGVEPSVLPLGVGEDSVSMKPYFTDPNLPSIRARVYTEMFRPNGPRVRPVNLQLYPPVPSYLCQDDVGYGGPGTSQLSVCGEPGFQGYLDSDQDAQLLLQGAPRNAQGFLFVGYDFDPIPWMGGTIAPGSTAQAWPIVTSGTGTLAIAIPPDPSVLGFRYYQAAAVDLALPGGYSISNAIGVETLPPDMEAMRDSQYKLILDNKTGEEAFFDLEADPFEQQELLSTGAMSAQQVQAYLDLKLHILAYRPASPSSP